MTRPPVGVPVEGRGLVIWELKRLLKCFFLVNFPFIQLSQISLLCGNYGLPPMRGNTLKTKTTNSSASEGTYKLYP